MIKFIKNLIQLNKLLDIQEKELNNLQNKINGIKDPKEMEQICTQILGEKSSNKQEQKTKETKDKKRRSA